MVEKVLLTDSRREYLNGEFDGTDTAARKHRSRITNRTEIALEELVEIAESPEIDNTDVFDPDDVFRLLRALLTPDRDRLVDDAPGGLTTNREMGDQDFNEYADRLYVQLDKFLRFRQSQPDS